MDEFNAGSARFEVTDEPSGDPIPVLAMYPAVAPEQPERLGPYTLSLARNAEVAAGLFALVVISHGTGGSPLVYRTTARHLARNGFVVLLPEHPRNNRNNNELAGTSTILINRPRHIRKVMDHASTREVFGPHLKPGTAAMIGHSLGGYTALAAAGGVPTAFAHEPPDYRSMPIGVTPDKRLQALVLLAPAAVWFMKPGALKHVRTPVLMLTAEHDPHTPPEHAAIVRNGVSDCSLIEHRVVANAGHFSFLSPFPPAMTNPAFAPSQDPSGFDRERFHDEMNAEISTFLRRVLSMPDGIMQP